MPPGTEPPEGWDHYSDLGTSHNIGLYDKLEVRAPNVNRFNSNHIYMLWNSWATGWFWGWTNLSQPVTRGTLEFDFWHSPSDNGGTFAVRLEDLDGTTTFLDLGILYAGGDTTRLELEGTPTGTTHADGDAHHVKVTFNGSHADLYVDQTPLLSGISYGGGAVERLSLWIYGNGHGLFYDNFRVEKWHDYTFNETFTTSTPGAHPTGWTCSDGGANDEFKVVSGGTTAAFSSQHLNTTALSGGAVSGYVDLSTAVSSGGVFEFDVNVSSSATGGTWAVWDVILQTTAGAADLLTVSVSRDRDGDYIRFDLEGTAGETQFAEDAVHHVRLLFYDGSAELFVNGALEHENVACTTGTVQRLALEATGTGDPFYWDNFGLGPRTKPTPPALLDAVPDPSYNGTITLAWDYVDFAASYSIYRADVPIFNTSNLVSIGTTTGTTYETVVPATGTIWYALEATNELGTSNVSNAIPVTAYLPVSPPVLVDITPGTSTTGTVELDWDDANLDNATEYRVYRETEEITSDNVESFTPIQTVPVSSSETSDVVDASGEYWYAVVAANGVNVSDPSVSKSVRAALPVEAPAVEPISPEVSTNGSIYLNWSDANGANVTSYKVYMDTANITAGTVGTLTPVATVTPTWKNWTQVVTQTTDRLWFAVVAHNGATDSPLSNVVNVSVRLPVVTPTLQPPAPNPCVDGQVTLDWDDVNADNATHYLVYRDPQLVAPADVAGLDPVAVIPATSSMYVDAVTVSGTTRYAVVATNGLVNTTASNTHAVTVQLPVEGPTLALASPNPTTTGAINLGWTDANGNNVTHYYVYRATYPITAATLGSLTPVDILGRATKTYALTITATGTYYFAVAASNGGVQALSNSVGVQVYITPPRPTGLAITPDPSHNGTLFLDWDDTPAAQGYRVYRHPSPILSVNASVTIVANVTASHFNETHATNATWYYAVAAENLHGLSPLSSCVNAQVLLTPPVWQVQSGDVVTFQEGLNYLELRDAAGRLVCRVTLSAISSTQFQVNHTGTNPTDAPLSGARFFVSFAHVSGAYSPTVHVEVFYNGTGLSAEQEAGLALHQYTGQSGWQELDATRRPASNSLHVTVAQLTTFSVASPAGGADIPASPWYIIVASALLGASVVIWRCRRRGHAHSRGAKNFLTETKRA